MAAWARGDYSAAGTHHRAALGYARESGQAWALALITALAGRSAHASGDQRAGDVLLRDAEVMAETVGEPMVLGSALDYRAHAAFAVGQIEEAAALATRSPASYSSIGYQEGLASSDTLAAQLAVLAGSHARADTLLHQALDVCQRLRHLGGTASVLEAMAVLDHDRGDDKQAELELSEARALRHRTGTTPSPALQVQLTRVVRALSLQPSVAASG